VDCLPTAHGQAEDIDVWMLKTQLAAGTVETAPVWYEFRQTRPEVLIPFVLYMLGVIVIAVIAHRYQKQSDFESEYYVGGRSFGAWVLAMSWVATLASGGSFLGYPSRVYSYGWSMAFWVSGSSVTAIVGLGIVGKRINRLARQTGALTLVDLLRDRFDNNKIGIVYGITIIFVTSIYLMAQFVAGARILESMLECRYETGLVVFSLSVVAYTTYGGFRAVAWTDTLQGIVMLIGIVILVPFAVTAVGGLDNATRQLAEREDVGAQMRGLPQDKHAYLYGPGPQKIPTGSQAAQQSSEGPSAPEPWLPIGMGISFFMLRSLGSVMMPTTVPRMLAFKDTRALRRALILLAPYFLLMYGSSLITMNCAHALDLGLAPDESDLAVPELAKKVAPAWLAGFLIAAPFAAVMSTVDSALLVISATVVRDLVQKNVRRSLTPRATKLLSYLVTGGTGVFAFGLALSEPPFLQPLIIYYVGGGASALFWPSLATIYWRRTTAAGVLAGLIGGGLTFVLFDLFRPLDSVVQLHPFVYGFSLSGLLVWSVSRWTPPQDPRRIEVYFGRAAAGDGGSDRPAA